MLGAQNLKRADSRKRFRNEEEHQEEHSKEHPKEHPKEYKKNGEEAGKATPENLQKTIKNNQIQNTNASAQHFFSRLFLPLNTHALPSFCIESLERICAEYKIDNEIPVIKQLKNITSIPNAPRNLLLALFFLLFNIDTRMKTIVLESESNVIQKKVCQFALLLRHEITPKFFIDEQQQLYKFVEACEEAYLLA